MYGVRGRDGNWLMSDRCLAWNFQTGEWLIPTAPEQKDGVIYGVTYAKLESGYAHCVNRQGNIFVRMKLSDMSLASFDTDQLGFFFSSGRKFEMFKDKAMLWGAVSTSNGDVGVKELNFETGTVTDHGVISVGNRKVVELVAVGS